MIKEKGTNTLSTIKKSSLSEIAWYQSTQKIFCLRIAYKIRFGNFKFIGQVFFNFSTNTESVSTVVQMEVIETQCDRDFKAKY